MAISVFVLGDPLHARTWSWSAVSWYTVYTVRGPCLDPGDSQQLLRGLSQWSSATVDVIKLCWYMCYIYINIYVCVHLCVYIYIKSTGPVRGPWDFVTYPHSQSRLKCQSQHLASSKATPDKNTMWYQTQTKWFSIAFSFRNHPHGLVEAEIELPIATTSWCSWQPLAITTWSQPTLQRS